jgi:hypothetical protein
MDIILAIGIGLVIFGAGLFNKRWAGWLSFFAFFPYWLAAVGGILGFPAEQASSGIICGQIMGTYLTGVALGWIPQLIIGKLSAHH